MQLFEEAERHTGKPIWRFFVHISLAQSYNLRRWGL